MNGAQYAGWVSMRPAVVDLGQHGVVQRLGAAHSIGA
jgi:hypothetical protein